MASKIEIINRGLLLVGMNKITSLTDQSPEAEIADLMYPSSLKTLLEECMWTFASKRVNLSQTVLEPAWATRGMNKVYTKPADLIKIFKTNPPNAFWSVEGDYILSDNLGLGVLYVYFNDVAGSYPPKFVEALAAKFAADIAYYVLNDANRTKAVVEMYESIYLPKAMSSDSQQGTPYLTEDNYWVDAKYRNGSRKQQYGL
jgi:hypothetical protein